MLQRKTQENNRFQFSTRKGRIFFHEYKIKTSMRKKMWYGSCLPGFLAGDPGSIP
jgi:hypothetical protein